MAAPAVPAPLAPAAMNVPATAESEGTTPLSVPLPGRVRRASAAGRATAAVAAESFPLSLSPSPLIRVRDTVTNSLAPVVKLRASQSEIPKAVESEAKMAQMRRVLHETTPLPPECTTTVLTGPILRHIFQYVGGNPKAVRCLNQTCSVWRTAGFDQFSELTLLPDCTTIDKLSNVGALGSLSEFCGVHTRGQHIRKLVINDARYVYSLPMNTPGPTMSVQALSVLLMNLPQLHTLDVRGIQMRNFATWCDHFLSDLTLHCPNLEELSVGSHFVKNWEPQWWQPMTKLHTLVIGSRREDNDWTAGGKPVTLAEDFFVMLRTNLNLHKVKVWCTLAPSSFTQLLLPTVAFPALKHLSINAQGNCQVKPMQDSAPPDAPVAPVAGKKEAKGSKKGVQEEPPQTKVAFPSLVSITVADVTERAEFMPELLGKLSISAPHLEYATATNTHRTAPGKVIPQAPTKGARLRNA